MTSNFVKLCTAALAGSLLGIAYERLPPSSQWPSVFQTWPTVTAASSTISRKGKQFDNDELSVKYVVDPVKCGENLKHSARYGLPSQDNLRLFNDFLISYDRRLRSPAWVIEHLTPEKLNLLEGNRKKSKFHEDLAVHDYFRAKNEDFIHSGFDRGHMAAAGNHRVGQDSLDQTFAFSNISPQAPEFNRGGWEALERYVRYRAKRSKNLYVVTGPLYLPTKARDGHLYVIYRVLGNNHVSVPTHYFKVFLYETNDGKFNLEAFLMPNDNKMDKSIKLDDFRVSIENLDTIERASGVIFFDKLNRSELERPTCLPMGFEENYQPDRSQKLIDKE